MKNIFRLSLVCFSVVVLSSFGVNKQEPVNASSVENSPLVSDKDEKDVVEVVLAGTDEMRFDKSEIKVKAGQTVKLTLNHTGEMAIKVMGHNFVLLEKGTDINEFGQKAMRAADNDYIPVDSKEVIAHTKMLGGGESTTIEFEAPKAGVYDFVCSFPGHYVLMKGKFIVE